MISGYDFWKTRTPNEDLPKYSICYKCGDKHYTDEMLCTESGYICDRCLEDERIDEERKAREEEMKTEMLDYLLPCMDNLQNIRGCLNAMAICNKFSVAELIGLVNLMQEQLTQALIQVEGAINELDEYEEVE